jgi:hypothetical protein
LFSSAIAHLKSCDDEYPPSWTVLLPLLVLRLPLLLLLLLRVDVGAKADCEDIGLATSDGDNVGKCADADGGDLRLNCVTSDDEDEGRVRSGEGAEEESAGDALEVDECEVIGLSRASATTFVRKGAEDLGTELPVRGRETDVLATADGEEDAEDIAMRVLLEFSGRP